MPAATDTPASKYDAELRTQLSQATSRIRFNDLAAGLLALAAVVMGYAAAMMLLDRWLVLPGGVRQAGFAGFLGVAGLVAYFGVFRPLRRVVNPLYAAKKVEGTIADAKNSVVNWVELKDRDLPASVKTAIGARAARDLEEADPDRATASKHIATLGCAAGLLFATLAVLFLLFKPGQFFSLVGRTFNPFGSTAIAARTQLTITTPETGDATVTAGNPVVIAVAVGGTIPDPETPDRIRLLLRHNPASPEFEVVPLQQGETNREWQVRVPDHLVQGGFWYKVVGGDATTPEHAVTVQTRPMFVDYEVRYEYPAYLRMTPDAARDPRIEAYRGTVATLTAKANRELKSARMVVDGLPAPIPGEVVAEDRHAVRFKITLANNASYRLHFTSLANEPNVDPFPMPIRVLIDQPPQLLITRPADEETTLPANGKLAIDANAGDDFGITGVTLRLRLAGGTPRELQPKPYRGGRSLKRETDDTYPYRLEYKDSADLAALKDAAGQPVRLTENAILEYWVEATDNCTVPKPNVGRSKVQRVRITAPPPKEAQDEQQKQAEKRAGDEAGHQKQQDQQLQNEPRPPKQPQRQDQPGEKPDPKRAEPQDGDQEQNKQGGTAGQDGSKPQAGTNDGSPKPDTPPEKGNDPKSGQPDSKQGTAPQDKTADPMPGDGSKERNPADKTGGQSGSSTPEQSPKGGGTDSNPPKQGGDNTPGGQQQPEKTGTGSQQPKGGTGSDPAPSKPDTGPPQPNPAGGTDPQTKPDGSKQGTPQPGSQQQPGGNAGDPQKGSQQSGGPKSPEERRKIEEQARKLEQELNKIEQQNQTGSGSQQEPKSGQQAGTPQEPKSGQPSGTPQAGGQGSPKEAPKPGSGTQQQPDPKSGGDPTPAGKTSNTPDPNAKTQPQPKAGTGDAAKRTDPGTPSGSQPKTGDTPPENAPQPRDGPKPGSQNNPTGGPPQQGTGTKPDGTPNDPSQPKTGGSQPDPESPNAGTPTPNEKPQPGPGTGSEKTPGTGQEKTAHPKAGGSGTKPDPQQAKEIEQAAKDLATGTPEQKQAARDKLVGPDARKKAEQLADDLQSDNPAKRDAARKEIEKLQDQARKAAGGKGDQQPLSQEEQQRLAEMAKDLASKDDAKREAAEQEFDKRFGKDFRDLAQKQMQDMQSGDPKRQEEARKRAEEMAKQLGRDNPSKDWRPGQPSNAGDPDRGPKLEDDPASRARSAALQLEKFEKVKNSPETLKKLGYTPEEYERFLQGLREVQQQQQQAAAQPAKAGPPPAGAPQIILNAGGNKVEARPSEAGPTAGGTAYAPPGYSDAQKGFAEEAAKLKKEKK